MGRRTARVALTGVALTGWVALVSLCLFSSPAHAAELAAAQAERATLIEGLQAQFQVGLIRERKLADDREMQLIDQAEARLKTARAAADAEKNDVRKANAELAAARADYAKLADSVAEHDAGARAEIAAYRAEAQNLAAQATPEKLAALQRFADGDRVGAWPVLEALTEAEDKAVEAAANVRRAAGQRELAALRVVMRDHGEASVADVIGLYEKVVALDPSVSNDWAQLVGLYSDAGRTTDAAHAAEMALSTANGDRERAKALERLGTLKLLGQGDLAAARKAFEESLTITQRLSAADPSDAELQHDVALMHVKIGEVLQGQGDLSAAVKSFADGAALFRQLAAAAPADAKAQQSLVGTLEDTSGALAAQGDLAGARKALDEANSIMRRLVAADPANAKEQENLLGTLLLAGPVMIRQGRLADARQAYEEAVAGARRLAQDDQASARRQTLLASAQGQLAYVLDAQGDLAAAQGAYQEALAVYRRLAAADPTNIEFQDGVAWALGSTGGVLARRGDIAGARKAFEEALARRAAQREPRGRP